MYKLFKKIHLWLALPFGIIISIICITGGILALERPITNLILSNRQEIISQEPTKEHPQEHTLQMQAPPKEGAHALKGKKQRLPFFRTVMRIHRWLLDAPAKRGDKTIGKTIVGVSTIAFAITLISGLFIWWPRNAKVLRNRLTVKCNKGWRRLFLDLHVSLGFWSMLLLLLMALTGLTWSFGWYREGFYSLFGTDAEVRRLVTSLHTGSWGGLFSQILYFIVAMIGGTLPLTGYYLWWKRTHK